MQTATSAYARTAKSGLTPREAEAAVLMKAAHLLQTVKDDWEGAGSGLAEAIGFNRKVWTVISSAASTEVGLPDGLRRNVVGLGVFVFKQSISALAEPTAEKLTALISINREIAAGLRGNP